MEGSFVGLVRLRFGGSCVGPREEELLQLLMLLRRRGNGFERFAT